MSATIETYRKGAQEVLNFSHYTRSHATNSDQVLQHKLAGIETAHITLHPDGTVNFRVKRQGMEYYLKQAVANNLQGYTPYPSTALRLFLQKVKGRI